MAVPNLFRLRYTEQLRDTSAFLRTFGIEMLDVLPPPEVAWNRLLVLRSAPGAGKTSILRLLTPESLTAVIANEGHEDVIRGLRQELERLGALDPGIKVLGIMVSVGKDYRSLVDLGPSGPGNQKIFFRLLDARITAKAIESVIAAKGLRYPQDAERITIRAADGAAGEVAREALSQLLDDPGSGEVPRGSSTIAGTTLLNSARGSERSVLAVLDSLLPVDWKSERGHSRLYSLPFLANVDFLVDGEVFRVNPVLLFDDVHDLSDDQRQALYAELLDRTVTIGRWIAERKSAVPSDELLAGSTEGRDFTLISLEEALMTGAKGGRSSPRLDRILGTIANSRAAIPLASAGVHDPFVALIGTNEVLSSDRDQEVLDKSINATYELVDIHPRYQPWVEDLHRRTAEVSPIEAAVEWRERQILIERDIARSQPTLFDIDVDVERASQMSSPSTRVAARLFLAHENKLPFYYGSNTLADLSSRNVEQYLGVSGDLFDVMTSAVTLRRGAHLTAMEQDQRIRRSSRRLWEAIPQRLANGRDVVALLHLIADRSRAETYRPTAPYAPGVTGAGIGFYARAGLFTKERNRSRAEDRLAQAIATAVANNLLEMSSDPTKTKGREWAVLYLNRLLCPHFDLPLQRGGWREQSVQKLAARLEVTLAATGDSRLPDPSNPLHRLEGWPQ